MQTPEYPVYVISKGRADTRLTSRSLERIGCPYRIVIEPQEFDQYAAVIDPAKILVLPFSNLGQGSIPARNWVWEHSIAEGHARHWILDDNIGRPFRRHGVIGFYRFHENLKTPVGTPTIFRIAERFVDRYTNVGIAGFNYFMFCSRKCPNIPPFVLNTRVYSCILLDNSLPFRWRGRYNEDTDLSLRILKSGLCSILFNAFLCFKQPTMTMRGGNSDELYVDDGRLQMAQSLVDQHPDVASVSWKWGRYQHYVDYSPFRGNKLIRRPGVVSSMTPNNYGLELYIYPDTGAFVPDDPEEIDDESDSLLET